MNPTGNDLARLRWPLAFLVLAIVVALALVATTSTLADRSGAEQLRLQAQQRELRAQLLRAPDEAKELRDKIALYQQLERQGLIGQEERLNWVEQIGGIKTARRLYDLQYELSPQRPLGDIGLPGGPAFGSHEFMASSMRMQLQLLHEEDLLGLLDDLRASVHAHLLVRQCTLGRLAANTDGRLGPQLEASCIIDWVTLREKRQ